MEATDELTVAGTPRCQGTTKSGAQCRKAAVAGGSRCAQHPPWSDANATPLQDMNDEAERALAPTAHADAAIGGWSDEDAEALIAEQEAAQRAAREAEAERARARAEKKANDNTRIMRRGRTVAFERSVPHATPRSSPKGAARRERKLALQRKRGFGGGR